MYPWAGKERTVNISKGQSQFAWTDYISSTITKKLKQLKSENHLKEYDFDTFTKRAAHYFNEMNAVHPFREGNGRTLRAFFDLLANEAGYILKWKEIDRDDYLHANIEGFQSNDMAMEAVFKKITFLSDQEIKLSHADGEALLHFFDRKLLLDNLINEKNRCLSSEPLRAREFSQQAHRVDKELTQSAIDIINKPLIKKALIMTVENERPIDLTTEPIHQLKHEIYSQYLKKQTLIKISQIVSVTTKQQHYSHSKEKTMERSY